MVGSPNIIFQLCNAVPFILIAYVHYIIWGKHPPQWPVWLPEPKSLWTGFYALIVVILAILIAIIFVLPFHNFNDCYEGVTNYRNAIPCYEDAIETEAPWFTAIWFIAAAYLYQIEYLLRHHSKPKSKNTSRLAADNKPSSSPSSSVTDTDLELDRLRGEMGLLKVKRKGKPPREN